MFPNSGPVRYIVGSHHWKEIRGVDFFNNDIECQDKIIKQKHNNYKIVKADIASGSLAIHGSKTYHSSINNISGSPRVGMVVHFSTEKAKKNNLTDKHSDYLNILNDHSICPIIYDS